MQHVLDNRTTQRATELHILRACLGAINGKVFNRKAITQALIGEVEEALTVKFIGA